MVITRGEDTYSPTKMNIKERATAAKIESPPPGKKKVSNLTAKGAMARWFSECRTEDRAVCMRYGEIFEELESSGQLRKAYGCMGRSIPGEEKVDEPKQSHFSPTGQKERKRSSKNAATQRGGETALRGGKQIKGRQGKRDITPSGFRHRVTGGREKRGN